MCWRWWVFPRIHWVSDPIFRLWKFTSLFLASNTVSSQEGFGAGGDDCFLGYTEIVHKCWFANKSGRQDFRPSIYSDSTVLSQEGLGLVLLVVTVFSSTWRSSDPTVWSHIHAVEIYFCISFLHPAPSYPKRGFGAGAGDHFLGYTKIVRCHVAHLSSGCISSLLLLLPLKSKSETEHFTGSFTKKIFHSD